jgi:hypothetical protein
MVGMSGEKKLEKTLWSDFASFVVKKISVIVIFRNFAVDLLEID